eukprot:15352114-Alexandrium_andersonii.AAC.1
MEQGIHERHTFMSRNIGSIHPTSSRGSVTGGAQEAFMHGAQGSGTGGGASLVFLRHPPVPIRLA